METIGLGSWILSPEFPYQLPYAPCSLPFATAFCQLPPARCLLLATSCLCCSLPSALRQHDFLLKPGHLDFPFEALANHFRQLIGRRRFTMHDIGRLRRAFERPEPA